MTILLRTIPLLALILLASPTAARAQVTSICHATGNPAAPFELLQVDSASTVDHLNHPDDLVPAPARGCPAQAGVQAPAPTPAYELPDQVPAPTSVSPRPRRPERRPRPRPRPRPRSETAPTVTSGGGAPSASGGNLGATASIQDDALPLTGTEAPLIALIGAGFLLAGAGVRLRYDAS